MLDLGTSASAIENIPGGSDAFGAEDAAGLPGRPEQVVALYVPSRRAAGQAARHGRIFPMAWPARHRSEA